MAKRSAADDLNQDNWDKEDKDKEMPGTYESVGSSVMQQRIIKKAKRTLAAKLGGDSKDTPVSSPFLNFGGFGSKIDKVSSFGFLASSSAKSSDKIVAKSDVKRNGLVPVTSGAAEQSVSSLPLKTLNQQLFASGGQNTTVSSVPSKNSNQSSVSAQSSSSFLCKKNEARDVEFYRQLKALNESFYNWINIHISKNPCCDFTPVVNDYLKHLHGLEKKYPLKTKQYASHGLSTFSFKVPPSPIQKSCDPPHKEDGSGNPGIKQSDKSSAEDVAESSEMSYGAGFKSNTTNTSTFSFGIKMTPTATVPSSSSGPASSCGSSEGDKAESDKPQFSFGLKKSAQLSDVGKVSSPSGAKPFTFAVAPRSSSTQSSDAQSDKANDEDYIPPKNEIQAVKEDDAFYTKKCKLFYKKEENFIEKGVAMLYLKPLEVGTQLLIRADTNIGKILLNIRLRDSIPLQRMGKNNVLLVCVPEPPMTAVNSATENDKPVPLLIRVKTTDDADELLDMLNRHKS